MWKGLGAQSPLIYRIHMSRRPKQVTLYKMWKDWVRTLPPPSSI